MHIDIFIKKVLESDKNFELREYQENGKNKKEIKKTFDKKARGGIKPIRDFVSKYDEFKKTLNSKNNASRISSNVVSLEKLIQVQNEKRKLFALSNYCK